MAEPPPPPRPGQGNVPLSRNSTADKELCALEFQLPPGSPTDDRVDCSEEQSSPQQPTATTMHPQLATMLGAMRETLPTDVCDKIQSVIDQVPGPLLAQSHKMQSSSFQSDPHARVSPTPVSRCWRSASK